MAWRNKHLSFCRLPPELISTIFTIMSKATAALWPECTVTGLWDFCGCEVNSTCIHWLLEGPTGFLPCCQLLCCSSCKFYQLVWHWQNQVLKKGRCVGSASDTAWEMPQFWQWPWGLYFGLPLQEKRFWDCTPFKALMLSVGSLCSISKAFPKQVRASIMKWAFSKRLEVTIQMFHDAISPLYWSMSCCIAQEGQATPQSCLECVTLNALICCCK